MSAIPLCERNVAWGDGRVRRLAEHLSERVGSDDALEVAYRVEHPWGRVDEGSFLARYLGYRQGVVVLFAVVELPMAFVGDLSTRANLEPLLLLERLRGAGGVLHLPGAGGRHPAQGAGRGVHGQRLLRLVAGLLRGAEQARLGAGVTLGTHEIVDVMVPGEDGRTGTKIAAARVLWHNPEELAVHGPDYACPWERSQHVGYDCILVQQRDGTEFTLPITGWSESRNSVNEETYRFHLEPPSALDELLTASS